MISKKSLTVGMTVRTSKRLPIEDQDRGKVLDLNLESATRHEVLVGWDTGTRTWVERRELFSV